MTLALPDQTTGGVEVQQSTGWRIRQGVVQTLRELDLPGIPPSQIVHLTVPSVEGRGFPCAVVSKTRGLFESAPGTNVRAEHRYAVGVLIARASSRGLDAQTQESQQLDWWFETVAKAFAGKRPGFTVPGVCLLETKVVDNDPRMLALWVQQLDAAVVTLHFNVREVRGG